ncbi:Histone-fold containing protein [Venustampulla echinocandica]|uniref:TBP-associated factor 6 n=1 Tax=Venustampulla echinocandica TaxID=2656787 RepID=A0A370TTC3_9HELO|nr:Histone-fold containing protein [Venustampulla echinocandica]RDL38775.1 Histone-fold containing protein [Venustampulla echinocandica]
MTESKLVWNPDNVRDVAESVGISSLNEEAVRSLSQEVEYRVGQVIVEAMRFMHQGKRTILGTQDISQALRVLDVEPLYGYESTRPLRFGEASLGPGQPLFYIEDEEVDFEKLINAPLPKVPRDMSLTAHWLSIEGVQPSIPQNPTTAEARATELVPKGPGANPSLAALAGNDNVSFKPLVKHVVSKELILFFDKIRSAILDDDPDPETIVLRESAFESVRQDPGLHQLVPYFINFAAEKVTHSLDNTFVLRQMMELTAALISNKSLFIDPYVASLVPPVLTCLLGHKLGPETPEDLKTQFQLRDLAASLIGQISRKYAESSHQLRPRLARTCLKYFLDPSRSPGEHYGAINGLSALGGPAVVRSVLLPNIKPFEYIITKSINERGQNDESVRMVIAAIMKAVTSITDTNLTITNGVNGATDDDGPMIEEFLGSVIGSRVVALGDRNLNKAILESRDKEALK